MTGLSIGEVRGRATGPVQMVASVRTIAREGAYWHVSMDAGELSRRSQPGQFVEVKVDRRGALLRRPFSIAAADDDAIEIVFDAHGLGTDALTTLEPGEGVDLVGPLGTSYTDPTPPVSRCLLVGGGYGVAPLGFLASRLRAGGHGVAAVVGAGTSARLPAIEPLAARAESVTVTTDDGTAGIQGLVTDVMAEVMERHGTTHVYACGPMPMLRAVGDVAAERGLPCQVAVEEHMACGVGICWTCVIPVRDPDGSIRNRRSCIDGPVLDAATIDWESTRWDVQP